MSQDETVARVFKLVDGVNQSSCLFRAAAENSRHDRFRQLAGEITQQLDNYGFELRTELQRLGVERTEALSSLSPAQDLSQSGLDQRCELALQSTLGEYQWVLRARLTAHARAMIRRQHLNVEQAQQALVALNRAA